MNGDYDRQERRILRSVAALNVLVDLAKSAADRALEKIHGLELKNVEERAEHEATLNHCLKQLEELQKDLDAIKREHGGNQKARWGTITAITVAVISTIGHLVAALMGQ